MQLLRQYRSDDYHDIIELFLLNTPQFFCPPEQEDLELFLKEELENYFVIENDGKIVACGGCNIEDNIGWLSWYIVHPAFHGQGLGRRIALHNINILKALPQVSSIEVRTSQLVYPFYEKLGFVLTGTADNYWGSGMHLYSMKLV